MRRWPAALAILLLAAAAALPGRAQTVTPAGRIVAVWGEGAAHARPDMATLSAGVATEGPTAHEALAANSQAMAKVIAAAKSHGIADRDLQTAGIGLSPVYARANAGEAPRIAHYRATNTLTIRVRRLDGLGPLIDALADAGANLASGLTLGVADEAKLAARARDAAMADAHDKAEALAKAANVALGPVLSISEEGAGSPVPVRSFAAAKATPVPIEAGETTVRARLRVVYAIR